MPKLMKKMMEQRFKYLDGPIQSVSDFFETMIENLEKSIPSSIPSRNKRRKVPRKRKL